MPSIAQTPDEQPSLFEIPALPGVDDYTAEILKTVAGDHLHQDDRRRIIEAILTDAAVNDGEVDPNRVRAALTGPHGMTVYPRVIGAVYHSLARSGVLTFRCWVPSTDVKGHNAGKPSRVYTLTRRSAA